MKELSKRIKSLRIERKLSQKSFAKILKISQPTLCRAEKDCRKIKFETMFKIFKELKFGIGFL